jgi:hypothetical protein
MSTMTAPHDIAATVRESAQRTRAAYNHGAHRPLGSFAALIGTYGATALALLVAGRARGVRARPAWSDLALAVVATHRSARLISKDSVTSVVRSPVARLGESGAPGETNDEPRGTGPRRAIGELITCPFCIAQWLGTGWVAGFAFAPRATRWAAATMSVITGADVLQFGWSTLNERAG